jgi:23S rRNA pseudouridine1911/1915/1917 synthase
MKRDADLKMKVNDKYINKKIIEILYKEFGMSGRFVRKLKKNKTIEINGEIISVYKRVELGDVIDIYFPIEACEDIPNEKIKIKILYEDKWLMAVEKPAGLLVHPIKVEQTDTLSNGISAYMIEKGENYIVRHVNRLDRDTSGVILIAKNSYIHDQIAVQMSRGEVKKNYQAIVLGILDEKSKSLEYPIGKPDIKNIRRAVMEQGKPSTTLYQVVAESEGASLLNIRLITGRTHQIRVHMAYIGHPVIGDCLYGICDESIGRQALHACSYIFKHPITAETVSIKSDLPEDMQKLIRQNDFE